SVLKNEITVSESVGGTPHEPAERGYPNGSPAIPLPQRLNPRSRQNSIVAEIRSVKIHLRRFGRSRRLPKAKPVAMTPTQGIRTYRSENVKLVVTGMRPGVCSSIQTQ